MSEQESGITGVWRKEPARQESGTWIKLGRSQEPGLREQEIRYKQVGHRTVETDRN